MYQQLLSVERQYFQGRPIPSGRVLDAFRHRILAEGPPNGQPVDPATILDDIIGTADVHHQRLLALYSYQQGAIAYRYFSWPQSDQLARLAGELEDARETRRSLLIRIQDLEEQLQRYSAASEVGTGLRPTMAARLGGPAVNTNLDAGMNQQQESNFPPHIRGRGG